MSLKALQKVRAKGRGKADADTERPTLLIVDDEEAIATTLANQFRRDSRVLTRRITLVDTPLPADLGQLAHMLAAT